MLEIGGRTKACLGSAAVLVSAVISSYAVLSDSPQDSLLAFLGFQVTAWGILPGLFLAWVGLRRDSGINAAKRQDEVLPAEGNRDAPFDQPIFRFPIAVLPLSMVVLCSLGPAFLLVYVPVVVFLDVWWLAPLILLLGATGVFALRDAIRLIRIAFDEAARSSPPAV